jgi:hypothetical protein
MELQKKFIIKYFKHFREYLLDYFSLYGHKSYNNIFIELPKVILK